MKLSKVAIIDIETNDLLKNMLSYKQLPYVLNEEARLWVVAVTNVGTGESVYAEKENITREWLQNTLSEYTHIVAHNGIKFDFIVLKLFGLLDYQIGYPGESDTLYGRPVSFVDTLVLSRIISPDKYGGHSLEAWGERLGEAKMDYRQACIDAGYVDAKATKGEEFRKWNPIMAGYCVQDTVVNAKLFVNLLEEVVSYKGWVSPLKMENKLADLGIRGETFGFYFDKELAVKCLEDLTEKMDHHTQKVLPNLPLKPMNKTELSVFIPPVNQVTKKNELTSYMKKFIAKFDADVVSVGETFYMQYKGTNYKIPFTEPIEKFSVPAMKDLDHIKMHLISMGWEPVEWRERDLTKDSKKQSISYEKRILALERWFKETMEGKYKEQRLEIVGIPPEYLLDELSEKLKNDWPVRVPTSPCVRVGVEKELCPNLEKLGEKVAFAKDFALYLTYKHRKSSIAGGEIEDMDFDLEYPNSGFLSMYREEDCRVSTPAIEIGASTNRYRHIGICNIARATSVYGKEMRSLFGSGPDALQFGYDFSSLEARVMGHYVINYKDGEELAQAMLAEKPNDIHSVNGRKLGIPRSDAKSLTYAVLYGASPNKIAKMLNVSIERAREIYDEFWNAVPALKELKEKAEKFWEDNGKKFIRGIDGRKINIRSVHSILNALFQSTGVIAAKYVNVFSMQKLEKMGHVIDPFVARPSVCEMIAYHDECQLSTAKENVKFKTFSSEEEAKQFVETWTDEGQLSAISEGKKWYLALPNDISLSIEEAIRDTENLLKFNVPLGYEWIVNTTWYGCH